MPSSLTSGGHYLDKHPAYNSDDLSANIVSNFNNYAKSWLMHAHNIRAISGDDLILEVSGNNRMIFYENDHSYNLCDLIGFKILNKDLTAMDANVRIPISANNYSFADPTSLLTSLTLNGSYVDLTGAGYTLKYAPSTINSKVHVRGKINYKSSAGTEQLITFRLMRDISGGSTGDILMTDSSLGSITGVTNHGIYNLEYLDSPATQEDVRYYLKFRIEAQDSDIVVNSGVLGYNDGNQNFFSAQEIYIPSTYQYTTKDCACEQLVDFQESLVVAGGSGTNTLIYSLNNGEEWIGLGNGVITNTCNDIVWSSENEKFIAVGSGTNTIAFSSRQGNEWRDVSLSTSIFSTSGNGIIWSGFRFVAVGEGTNTIAHSGDGLYWRAVPNSASIFSTRGNKVAYGNNRFIAVGEGTNTIAYSDDGMNWVGLGTSIFSSAGYAIIWTGNIWVAGGEGTNTLAISIDNGYNWIGLGTSIFSTKVMGLGTNDISMVAVGSGTNTIAYSNNGSNWTGATSVFAGSSIGTSVSWVGDRFIATSNDGTHTTAYSYDGINWTGTGNSELSTIANAVATNKDYLGLNDKFLLMTGLGIDVSFRHVDISGVLEVSGNAQIDNILIDTNTISTTDGTGHLHLLTTNGGMNSTSNLDMSLISVTGKINIESHQNTTLISHNGQMELISHQQTNLTSQNEDVNIVSSTQDVHITSHQQTNITSQNAQTNMTAHQQNNITAQNGQTNITSHQQFGVQAQNGDVNLVSSAQDVNITSHQNTVLLSQNGDVNLTSSTQDVNVTSHQQTNITSQNAQTNLSSAQQVNVTAQTGQVNVTSSQGNIQMTSHQQTTIASQNSNVSIQSVGTGTTQIGPSLTVDNVLIDGNSISEQGGGGLQLQSSTNIVSISSGGGDTTISPSLQVDNVNIDGNNVTAISGNLNVTAAQQTNITSQAGQTNITSHQQANITSQNDQVNVTSSTGNIQMTSHQQTTIGSQNGNVLIQSVGSGTTQISPSITVDNLLIDGSTISSTGGNQLVIDSASGTISTGNDSIDMGSGSLTVGYINVGSGTINAGNFVGSFSGGSFTGTHSSGSIDGAVNVGSRTATNLNNAVTNNANSISNLQTNLTNGTIVPNSATKLQTARTIAGVSFDGTGNINIPYSNLTGLPTIPTNNNQLTNGAGYITGISNLVNIGDVPALVANKYLKVNASANGLSWEDAGGSSVPSSFSCSQITGNGSYSAVGGNQYAAASITTNLRMVNPVEFTSAAFFTGNTTSGHGNSSTGNVSLYSSHSIAAGAGVWDHSDDRLKHNEVNISSGLEIVRQLQPKYYDRSSKMNETDSSQYYKEAGLIAQDVLAINDLSYSVIGGNFTNDEGVYVESPYYVKYNNLFVYGLAATKELDMIVQLQAEKMNELDLSVNMLQSLLNSSDLSVNRLESKVSILETELANIKAILSTANL